MVVTMVLPSQSIACIYVEDLRLLDACCPLGNQNSVPLWLDRVHDNITEVGSVGTRDYMWVLITASNVHL